MTDGDAIEKAKPWSQRDLAGRGYGRRGGKRGKGEIQGNQSTCLRVIKRMSFSTKYFHKYFLSTFQLPVMFLTIFTQQGAEMHFLIAGNVCTKKRILFVEKQSMKFIFRSRFLLKAYNVSF